KVVDEAQKASDNSGAKPTPSTTAPSTAGAADANAPAGAATATPAATPSPSNTAATGTTAPPTPSASNPTPNQTPATSLATSDVQKEYYNLLSTAGLITLPTDWQTWLDRWTLGKVPGILLSALL